MRSGLYTRGQKPRRHTAVDSIVTLAAEIMNLFKVVVLLHLPAGLDPNRITEQRLLGIDYHFTKSSRLVFGSVIDRIHFTNLACRPSYY